MKDGGMEGKGTRERQFPSELDIGQKVRLVRREVTGTIDATGPEAGRPRCVDQLRGLEAGGDVGLGCVSRTLGSFAERRAGAAVNTDRADTAVFPDGAGDWIAGGQAGETGE